MSSFDEIVRRAQLSLDRGLLQSLDGTVMGYRQRVHPRHVLPLSHSTSLPAAAGGEDKQEQETGTVAHEETVTQASDLPILQDRRALMPWVNDLALWRLSEVRQKFLEANPEIAELVNIKMADMGVVPPPTEQMALDMPLEDVVVRWSEPTKGGDDGSQS